MAVPPHLSKYLLGEAIQRDKADYVSADGRAAAFFAGVQGKNAKWNADKGQKENGSGKYFF